MIASVGASIVYIVLLSAKERKLPLSIKDALLVGGIILISMVVFAPFNVGDFFIELLPHDDGTQSEGKNIQLGKLFHWYQGIKNDLGLPDFYFTYNQTHGSLHGGI